MCEFLLSQIAFLGHVVSSDGFKVDHKKIEAVRIWPRPLTPINIRCLLGLVGYYRSFVQDFSSILSLLTMLTQKKVIFMRTDDCEKSFQILKD